MSGEPQKKKPDRRIVPFQLKTDTADWPLEIFVGLGGVVIVAALFYHFGVIALVLVPVVLVAYNVVAGLTDDRGPLGMVAFGARGPREIWVEFTPTADEVLSNGTVTMRCIMRVYKRNYLLEDDGDRIYTTSDEPLEHYEISVAGGQRFPAAQEGRIGIDLEAVRHARPTERNPPSNGSIDTLWFADIRLQFQSGFVWEHTVEVDLV